MYSGYKHEVKIDRVKVGTRSVRFAEVGDDEHLPVVVLIHGAPGTLSGSSKHFFNDVDLLSKAKIVSIDRPGYGYSDFGQSVVSIEEQAALIKPVLEKYKDQPKILVGSSYGGPIIARIAADYPELVDALVFVSASVAPGEEKVYKISYPANKKVFRWMVPKMLRVANDEKLAHRQELMKLEPLLSKISIPATIIHGTADKLIYPNNAYYLQQKLMHLNPDFYLLDGQNHYVIWETPQIVRDAIMKYLEEFQTEKLVDAGE
jgi:pimeloyl-ACP methyl ester carboxylesterase